MLIKEEKTYYRLFENWTVLKLKSPSPKNALYQVWFFRKWFLKFVNIFSLFCYYLPLENGMALRLNSLDFPSPKDDLALCLVEIGPLGLKKKIIKDCQCIFAISSLSPLEKCMTLHLNRLESPSPKDTLCQIWLKLALWFLRRWNYEKFTDRRRDDGQQLIRKAHLSLQLRRAKKNNPCYSIFLSLTDLHVSVWT